MSADNLTHLTQQVEAFVKFAKPPVHSFLIQHHGQMAAEFYWWGYSPSSYQPMFSVTKSVVSALVGVALGDGKLTLSDRLARWFPDYSLGKGIGTITVQHLLTMTAGFAPLKAKPRSDDWFGALLCRPLAALPGTQFHYDNDALDLLVAIVERALGESFLDIAHHRLFAPLGIWQGLTKSQRKQLWKRNTQGPVKGGYGLYLTTREMAVFGQLYAQNGNWQGEQLLPAEFITSSTTAQASGGYPKTVKYGYLWWITTTNAGHPAFFASGRSGQYIYVVPALNLVAVITSASQNADGRGRRVMLTRLAMQFVESQEADK